MWTRAMGSASAADAGVEDVVKPVEAAEGAFLVTEQGLEVGLSAEFLPGEGGPSEVIDVLELPLEARFEFIDAESDGGADDVVGAEEFPGLAGGQLGEEGLVGVGGLEVGADRFGVAPEALLVLAGCDAAGEGGGVVRGRRQGAGLGLGPVFGGSNRVFHTREIEAHGSKGIRG